VVYCSVSGEVIANGATDDPEIYDGAHVSLQIVGKRLQEEKMLAIAAHVENLLNPGQ
jgi:Asp-tRNA(Asn)/Glu-tRNA(Gln) amidotransferase A subunit family amidase